MALPGGVTLREIKAGELKMRVAEAGGGPLVLLCHGWPESWYSWRHQIVALAAAGYRVAAPDMRGYGGTEAPEAIDAYTLMHLVGDMVALVGALGESRAVIVGHDWGAPVAWHSALLRPDLFRAVVGMSVPYTPPSPVDFLKFLADGGVKDFYIQYFQAPGVAEAELERDVKSALRRLYFTASGDLPQGGGTFALLTPGGGLLGRTVDPATLPAWLPEADLDYYAGEFGRTGFRGGLNWYRNISRNVGLMAPWRGQPIRQPSLFIAGSKDGVLRFPRAKDHLAAFVTTLPGNRGSHILEGAGHWVQQERAAEVNRLLVDFLKGLPEANR
jgi:pimeloyl-ACP methyl ester carboxylesterase